MTDPTPPRPATGTKPRLVKSGRTAMQEKPTAKSAKKERPLRQKRNADETRRRILETATTEFAAEGYNGARIDVICEKAKTNPRMIYHYFGDKSGLYVAVLERVLGDLRREELKIEVDDV